MRLLLLPISTRRTLIYCEPLTSNLPAADQSYLDKAVNYAGKTWAGWEKSDTTWKLKITQYGNKALRRIPFEEWGLKSIPQLKKKQKEHLVALLQDRNAPGMSKEIKEKTVEVRFPGSYQRLTKETVTQTLQRLSTERQGLHRSRLIYTCVGMPFTIPFAFIPVIPNFPFLYLAFRAFSHWRALSGSRHLEFLVRTSLLSPSPSTTLDSLYTSGLLHASREASRKAAEPTTAQTKQVVDIIQKQLDGSGSGAEIDPPYINKAPPKSDINGVEEKGTEAVHAAQEEEILLLSGWNGKMLAERLDLPGLEIEIERAVEQVEKDLAKGKELKQEKQSLEAATGGSQTKAEAVESKR